MAAKRFDFTLHHVQTDTTTRNLGHCFRGTETRMEDKLQDFFLINNLIRFDQIQTHRFFTNLLRIDPLTIITKGHDYIGSLTTDVQDNRTHFRLVQCDTICSIFQTMVNRVTQHMLKWCDQTLENVTIQFTFGILYDQFCRTVQGGRGLTHNTL
ncbi:MAG: hypothetical protein ACD_6C00813G0017 [uncultured bacterium]|nr:MAG: hypothetical protein ACD_6C00813G0017 [uncultured bacterium]